VAFLPGSVGGLEVLVLFAIVLILFGPHRLPQMARDIGRMIERLRRASDQFRDQLMRLDEDDDEDTQQGHMKQLEAAREALSEGEGDDD
jgi:sec-independent protein translocase protein TatB